MTRGPCDPAAAVAGDAAAAQTHASKAKEARNIQERQRRDKITSYIGQLKELLPPNSLPVKPQIHDVLKCSLICLTELTNAVEQCRRQHSKESQSSEAAYYKTQNQQLRRILRHAGITEIQEFQLISALSMETKAVVESNAVSETSAPILESPLEHSEVIDLTQTSEKVEKPRKSHVIQSKVSGETELSPKGKSNLELFELPMKLKTNLQSHVKSLLSESLLTAERTPLQRQEASVAVVESQSEASTSAGADQNGPNALSNVNFIIQLVPVAEIVSEESLENSAVGIQPVAVVSESLPAIAPAPISQGAPQVEEIIEVSQSQDPRSNLQRHLIVPQTISTGSNDSQSERESLLTSKLGETPAGKFACTSLNPRRNEATTTSTSTYSQTESTNCKTGLNVPLLHESLVDGASTQTLQLSGKQSTKEASHAKSLGSHLPPISSLSQKKTAQHEEAQTSLNEPSLESAAKSSSNNVFDIDNLISTDDAFNDDSIFELGDLTTGSEKDVSPSKVAAFSIQNLTDSLPGDYVSNSPVRLQREGAGGIFDSPRKQVQVSSENASQPEGSLMASHSFSIRDLTKSPVATAAARGTPSKSSHTNSSNVYSESARAPATSSANQTGNSCTSALSSSQRPNPQISLSHAHSVDSIINSPSRPSANNTGTQSNQAAPKSSDKIDSHYRNSSTYSTTSSLAGVEYSKSHKSKRPAPESIHSERQSSKKNRHHPESDTPFFYSNVEATGNNVCYNVPVNTSNVFPFWEEQMTSMPPQNFCSVQNPNQNFSMQNTASGFGQISSHSLGNSITESFDGAHQAWSQGVNRYGQTGNQALTGNEFEMQPYFTGNSQSMQYFSQNFGAPVPTQPFEPQMLLQPISANDRTNQFGTGTSRQAGAHSTFKNVNEMANNTNLPSSNTFSQLFEGSSAGTSQSFFDQSLTMNYFPFVDSPSKQRLNDYSLISSSSKSQSASNSADRSNLIGYSLDVQPSASGYFFKNFVQPNAANIAQSHSSSRVQDKTSVRSNQGFYPLSENFGMSSSSTSVAFNSSEFNQEFPI